jgi:arabinan endo-1,5-alpha-L-arabinosidase
MKALLILLLLIQTMVLKSQNFGDTVGKITPTRQTIVHDPVIIRQGDVYYIFCTGMGISVFSSKDMKQWKKEKPVFAKIPDWIAPVLPGFKGHVWAPDISYHNGKYYLYYAVSAFGKNTSCIGLAINKTLDPKSPDFKWEDKGMVIQSVPGRDMWNAIDPNEIDDEAGNHWLAFGSFWDGIKLVKLNDDMSRVAEPETWHTIASRPRDSAFADSLAGNAAIEAPFIYRYNNYYYLFVSWDYCCRAEKSDYKVMVGRSKSIVGPYLDKNGVAMTVNGGSVVVQGDNKEWFGAGHNAVGSFDGTNYIVFHGYDALDKGKPKLIIDHLEWNPEGWPVAKIY